MSRIFICYRRADSEAYAGRIHDRLAEVHPRDRLFMDVETLEPGEDFVSAISSAVGAVDVVIAVIGPKWAIAADGRRLLDDPHDWVRTELVQALERRIRIIPVLVGGTVMPTSEALPPDLQPITRLHAIEISHTRFATDIDRLIRSLGLGDRAAERARSGGTLNWQRLSAVARTASAGAGTDRRLWVLTLLEMVGVLTVLGAVVVASYPSFYLIMWAFLLLGVAGLTVSFLAHRTGNAPASRFGWAAAVISIVAWGFGVLFPEPGRWEWIVATRTFEIGFRLTVLVCGAVVLFLGLKALVAIGDAPTSGRKA